MPEKSFTVLTYAAGASFAAAFLAWIFSPSIFKDSDGFAAFNKPGVVGLLNPANDCFINSVLQALASLDELRKFLAQEHARYSERQSLPKGINGSRQPKPPGTKRAERLQEGAVSAALKEVLDRLSEVPTYKKTISARDFIAALEYSFDTRLSRQQQDAQELLHLVVERVNDEYEALKKASQADSESTTPPSPDTHKESSQYLDADTVKESSLQKMKPLTMIEPDLVASATDSTTLPQPFPMEGLLESEIECQTCHFTPKPSKSPFLVLTLNVLHQSSTSLDHCFDTLLKQEFIDDYKCDSCRLTHALRVKTQQLERASSPKDHAALESDIDLIRTALATNPEKPPEGVTLPPNAPTSRISRHTKMTSFPKVLAVHLSRSIFNTSSFSTKNDAKVGFAEDLVLGGFKRKDYRLRSIVTHRGGHNSGHYETFRRQVPWVPKEAVSEPGTSLESNAVALPDGRSSSSTLRGKSQETMRPSSDGPGATLGVEDGTGSSKDTTPGEPLPAKRSRKSRKKNADPDNRWWRISDDRSSDCRTSDVLAMQREAYLLFYERVDS